MKTWIYSLLNGFIIYHIEKRHKMKEMSCFIQMHFALAQHVNKEKKVHLWPQLIEHKKTTTYDVVSSIYLAGSVILEQSIWWPWNVYQCQEQMTTTYCKISIEKVKDVNIFIQ
jgi:hypothetical protein